MSLLQQQKLLADLYTNLEIRKEYFSNPSDNKPDQNEVTIFSEGLVLKRLNAVKSWLPLSFAYQNNLLYKLFLSYAPYNPMKGMHLKHQMDVLAFFDFIKKQPDIEAYLLEILKFEVFKVKSSLPKHRFLLLKSEFYFSSATSLTIHNKKLFHKKIILIMLSIFKKRTWIRI